MKTCIKCNLDKPLVDFTLRRGKPGTICKVCTSEDYKLRYPKERERERTVLKHGLNILAYYDILAQQGWRCAICGEVQDKETSFFIDHDHTHCPGQFSCGNCIRGLLCRKCNTGLGMFRDNPDFLQSAINYLELDYYG